MKFMNDINKRIGLFFYIYIHITKNRLLSNQCETFILKIQISRVDYFDIFFVIVIIICYFVLLYLIYLIIFRLLTFDLIIKRLKMIS